MSKIEENYQRITDDRRLFDIRFWQSQGDFAIFEAVAEMLNDYLLIRGKNADESRLQKLLKIFEKHRIRYLVVGGYAVMKYSEPRFTKDLDIWIATDTENADAVYAALKEFGAPLANLTADDFTHKDYFYQMGRPPLRIDIMMSIPGVEFEEAWKNHEVIELNDLKIPFISRSDLIRAKEASGRPQDKIDIDNLKKAEQLDALQEK